ncbi:MAG: sulfoxide reductase heme-binding subunit YedZ [Clostridia bacterium]|nr:MAG: sulfoxide reductase heme-binding subunit YedZ [Clostridia bacterium]
MHTLSLSKLRFTPFQILVHLASLLPLAALLWDIWQGQLSVNPIQDITFRTGKAAMVLLVLSLAATPLNTVFGFRQAVKVRRALGLYAFLYATLHFFTYAWLDYGWNLRLIGLEITEKLYVLVGFASFLILIPLAVTSTKGWQRRLKKRWKKLHRWVYLAAALVALHYIWVQKADIREPLIWTGILTMLLLLRWRRLHFRLQLPHKHSRALENKPSS